MRLLRFNSAGELSLTDDLTADIPRYAILSHTWRLDGDEVTFEDLQSPSAKSKAGYDKIQFCGDQARKDGLQYFWVDTCCIKKSSSAELQEAITSMFRWYQEAVKCYVYLSDVSTSIQDDEGTTQLAFQNSRWFKRGWTLQELLAPKVVEFYSQQGQLLGDKMTLEQLVYEATSIPIAALRGAPLSEFSQDERLRWAEKRETKKKEDKAYCLLGILNVFMYLSYGEGHNAFKRLNEEIGKSAMHHSSKPVWHVPFPKLSGFVGRTDELSAVKRRLSNHDNYLTISLLGLGGVGKTRLALELAYWVKSEYSQHSVFWIQAEKLLTFEEDILQIGRKLGIPGINDAKADVKNLVRQRLQNQSDDKWLLILDNADDEVLWRRRSNLSQQNVSLVDFLPRAPNGTILVTTRSRLVANFLSEKDVVDVQALSAASSVEMFANRLRSLDLTSDRTALEKLSEKLMSLPLAIAQASSFINETQCSVKDYLELLNEPEESVIELLSKDFGDQSRYPSALNPIATAWLVSFQHIHRHHPVAAAFLSSMACLHEKSIPLSLLPKAGSKLKTIEAIGVLAGYAFIEKRVTDDSVPNAEPLYDMHRLVQLAARNWLKMENKLMWEIRGCTVRLVELFPARVVGHKNIWSIYLPHGQRLCEKRRDFTEHYRLLENIGRCFWADGKYDESVQTHTIVVDWMEKKLGISDKHTLQAYGNLGKALSSRGDHRQAEKYHRQALDGKMEFFGPEHLDTLTSLGDLAATLLKQGRMTEGEELEAQVLEIRWRVLGEEHPDTLVSMSNLAAVLLEQGRFTQAKELEVQVLEIKRRVLGMEHPDTLISMSNLALVLSEQGRFTQAEELGVQVLEIKRRVLGMEHPETLISMSILAITYGYQGRLAQAEELCVQVLETRKRVLGMEHPETLVSISNLASTYRYQDRSAQAEELDVQVLETRKRVLGEEHPDTLASMGNLALTYQNQGQLTQAEELEVQVLETRKRVLGREHPDTLTAMNNLAVTYMRQQRKGDAVNLMRPCVDLRVKILGSSHPNTQSSTRWLRKWTGNDEDTTGD